MAKLASELTKLKKDLGIAEKLAANKSLLVKDQETAQKQVNRIKKRIADLERAPIFELDSKYPPKKVNRNYKKTKKTFW